MPLGKCNLKQECDTTAHPGEQPKPGTATPHVLVGTERQELSLIAGGSAHAAAPLEYSSVASYKTKHTLTTPSTNCPFWYFPKGAESLCLHKNLHMGVYNALIQCRPSSEAIKVLLSR